MVASQKSKFVCDIKYQIFIHILHALSPITQEAEADRAREYEVCLVYKLSSQPAKVTQ